jgi:hypothetical protein
MLNILGHSKSMTTFPCHHSISHTFHIIDYSKVIGLSRGRAGIIDCVHSGWDKCLLQYSNQETKGKEGFAHPERTSVLAFQLGILMLATIDSMLELRDWCIV